MQHKTLTKADLNQFTGSQLWYRHGLARKVVYTDGVQYVAEHGGAYWLIDEIALSQYSNKAVAAEEFQVWDLRVNADHSAILTCGDGNGRVVHIKELEFTDFPLDEIRFFFVGNTIMLPSEYRSLFAPPFRHGRKGGFSQRSHSSTLPQATRRLAIITAPIIARSP